MTARVDWNPAAFEARFRAAVGHGVTAAAAVASRRAEVNLGSPGPTKPGSYPGVDTGNLRNSIGINGPETTGQWNAARWGSNSVYAKIHEFGGPITAGKTSKFLTIPLTKDAKLLRRRVRSLREIPGMRVFRAGGKLFLGGMKAESPGVKRKYRALFKLVKSVFVPPRPWLMRSTREAAPEMVERFRYTLQASLRKGVR